MPRAKAFAVADQIHQLGVDAQIDDLRIAQLRCVLDQQQLVKIDLTDEALRSGQALLP